MKKISFIIPVYNGSKYIERCLKNLLNYRGEDVEFIIINDGSYDETDKILKKYKNNDKRIIYINKRNTGVSNTRNVGLDKAIGEYIVFIDIDDYLEENTVYNLLQIIKNNHADLYIMPYFIERNGKKEIVNYSFINRIYDTKEKIFDLIPNLIGNVDEKGNRIQNIMGSIWSKVFKSEIIKENNIIMNEKIEITEDLNFLIEYIVHCNKVKIVNYYFYNYVVENNQSITKKYKVNLYNQLESSLNNISKILKKNGVFLDNVIKYKKFYNIYASLVNECKNNINLKNKRKNILKFCKILKKDKIYIKGLSKKEKIIKIFLEKQWILPLIIYYSKSA